MKNQKEFLRAYEELSEECFKKWGYYYPPRTWNELITWDNNFFEKYLKDKENGVIKTKSYINLAAHINYFGFYDLFQNFEFEKLNNVLFQTSRQVLLDRGRLASGTDHCNVFFNVLLSFSCNDFKVIDHFFPKELPQSEGKFYTEVSVNLLKVLYYNQIQFKSEAIEKANKFLSKKNRVWDEYVVLYFKALIDQNAAEASIYLQELCKAYQKIQSKLTKCFAYEIHGLYRFAMIVNKELFKEIKQPTHNSYLYEFETWQKEQNYPIGKLFYKYPIEMDYINKVFEAELPKVELYKPYPNKKVVYKNVDKFIEDLTENTLKNL
ncbi:MAG: hypothetical protein HYR91_09905 [Flavobacteriia bacterium]|nr:hypothetical protein [Flavobacteriia bacterium]